MGKKKEEVEKEVAEAVDEVAQEAVKAEMRKDRAKYAEALQKAQAQLDKLEDSKAQLIAQAQRVQGAIAYIDAYCAETPSEPTDTAPVGETKETPADSESSEPGSSA